MVIGVGGERRRHAQLGSEEGEEEGEGREGEPIVWGLYGAIEPQWYFILYTLL